jgi:hypothetical protein
VTGAADLGLHLAVRLLLSIGPALPATVGLPGAPVDPPPFNSRCGDVDCRVERARTPWQLGEVGIDLRVLTLSFESGGCWRGGPDAVVTETKSDIRIAVYQDRIVAADLPDGRLPCADDVEEGVMSIRLASTVDGRRIRGGPVLRRGGAEIDRAGVPRVLDLNGDDAIRALRLQGYRVRRIGKPTDRVAFQSPLPGAHARRKTVRLTLGRHWYDGRALKRCFASGGIAARARRPRPGDADAPDLVLWLTHPGGFGIVGLYADPGRASELAPRIRRRTRHSGGTLERRRYATLVWVPQPALDLRRHARACAYGLLGRPRRARWRS